RAMVELLLQRGANPNVRARDGLTPLHKAALHNPRKEVLEVLLAYKADPNLADNEGRTPLDYVTQGVRPPVSTPSLAIPPPAGRPKPILSPRQDEIAGLLRKAGATEWAPRPGQITLTRRSSDRVSAVFRKGTNDNQFTL